MVFTPFGELRSLFRLIKFLESMAKVVLLPNHKIQPFDIFGSLLLQVPSTEDSSFAKKLYCFG